MTQIFWLVAILLVGLVLRVAAQARVAVRSGLPEIRQQQWREPSTSDQLADLGAYELAYLLGGAGHAVDAALATLYRNRLVRISREGQVSPVTGRPDPTEPLERAVLEALAATPQQPWPAADLRLAVAGTTAISDIHRRVQDLGMLTPDELLAPVNERLRNLLTVSIVVIVSPWLLMVIAALSVPDSPGPAVDPALLSTAAGGFGIWAYAQGRRAVETVGEYGGWRGERFASHRVAPAVRLAMLRKSDEVQRGPAARRALVPVGLAVALGGLAALGDPTIEAALRPPEPETGSEAGAGCGGCGGGCGCGG